MKVSDCHPYPHKFHVELSLEKFIETYEDTQPGTVLEKTVVSVAGKSKCFFLNTVHFLFLKYNFYFENIDDKHYFVKPQFFNMKFIVIMKFVHHRHLENRKINLNAKFVNKKGIKMLYCFYFQNNSG